MDTRSIIYPSHITWKVDLRATMGWDKIVGHEKATRIQKAEKKLLPEYRFEREEVNESYLKEFLPLYERHIQSKENGVVFNVRKGLEEGRSLGREYEVISLRRDGVLEGGMIYSVREDCMSVAYRVFPFAVPLRLPISVSYIAEKYLFDRGISLQKPFLFHGRDRVPYGHFSNIGVAEYKLGIGCVPYVSDLPNTTFIETKASELLPNTFYFLGDKGIDRITQAILVSQDPIHAVAKHSALFSPRTGLRVTVIPSGKSE